MTSNSAISLFSGGFFFFVVSIDIGFKLFGASEVELEASSRRFLCCDEFFKLLCNSVIACALRFSRFYAYSMELEWK